MRRFARILFDAGAAASLLLCAAAVVLWVRSHFVHDQVIWTTAAGDLRWVQSSDGRASIMTVGGWRKREPCWLRGPAKPTFNWFAPGAFSYQLEAPRTIPIVDIERRKGVESLPVWHVDPDGAERLGSVERPARMITMPWRTLVVVLAAFPVTRLVRLLVTWCKRRRLRRGEDCCPACGYDVRATPDRCPECGTVAAKA